MDIEYIEVSFPTPFDIEVEIGWGGSDPLEDFKMECLTEEDMGLI